MRTIMAAVMSRDGLISNDNVDDIEWKSAEDFQRFSELRKKHNLYVMGRKTYSANAGNMIERPGLLRVVLTSDPLKYANLENPGHLEFTNETPEELVKRFRKENRESLLLLGGSDVYEAFLGVGLVDEIDLTVEPIDLISGVPLLPHGKKLSEFVGDTKPTIEVLNAKGTKLYHYVLNN
jgi:dihydrofolate reductase